MVNQTNNNRELERIENDTQNATHPVTNRSRPTGSLISRFLFQRLLILSVVRLIIYLNKLYQDCNAVNTYYSDHDFYFCIISIVSLICPPIVYAFYLVGESLVKHNQINQKEVSTKTVNGLLLIPWQIKRHLDVLHFVSERICMCRSPKPEEEEDLTSMNRNAEVLEFFEDFYAGFLQILLQLYILMLLLAKTENFQTQVLIGELIGSGLCVLSMMIAVRRRDDGILTSILSFVGWLSLFVSRVVAFSLVASEIGIYIIVLALIHSLSISIWVYNIAIESHLSSSSTQTSEWTTRKRMSMAIMVFLFFGLPSLLIWPIMFQLKEYRRPLKFLLIVTLENIGLLVLWFIFQFSKGNNLDLGDTHMWLVLSVVCATLAADLFLSGYVICKPKLTDQVVLHKMRATDTESYGIYYEFCDIVFKLPNTELLGQELEAVSKMYDN